MGLKTSRVIHLREYEHCVVAEISPKNLALLRTHFHKYLTVSRAWQPANAYQLTAKNYIGTIVLSDLRIIIAPKMPVETLFFMLSHAYDLPLFRKEQDFLASNTDLFTFIVRLFVTEVGDLVRHGLYRAYLEQDENLSYLRGRLLLSDHLRRNLVSPHRFYQRGTIYSAELIENQLLKYTLWRLSRTAWDDPTLRAQIKRTSAAFADVPWRVCSASDCDQVRYHRLNQQYETPIHWARLLLQNLSLAGHTGDHPFAAFLLPMHTIFERFVARFLQTELAQDPAFAISAQPEIALDVAKKEKIIPDIVLKQNGQPHLVIDTKYKQFSGAPSPADRNQMVMYCHMLGIQKGLLLYAGTSDLGYQGDYRGVAVSAETLPLTGPASTLETHMKQFITRLKTD